MQAWDIVLVMPYNRFLILKTILEQREKQSQSHVAGLLRDLQSLFL